jgi:hypothetical protein
MAADLLIGLLRHPIAIVVWVCILLGLSVVTYRANSGPPPIRPLRLFGGYSAAFAVCIALAAVSAYVPREEATAVWHVPPERYREAITREFFDALVMLVFFAGLGIALVGVPVVFRLARAGRAQIGWVLLASAGISAAFSVALSILFLSGSISWLRAFLSLLGYSLSTHLLLSLGFSLAAGLPWRAVRAGT